MILMQQQLIEKIDVVIKQLEFLTQHAEHFKHSAETTLAWRNLQMATKWLDYGRVNTVKINSLEIAPLVLFKEQIWQWDEFFEFGGDESFFIVKIEDLIIEINNHFISYSLPTNDLNNIKEAKFWYEISLQTKKLNDEREFDNAE